MTVNELINALYLINGDATVRIYSGGAYDLEICEVAYDEFSNGQVTLLTEKI